MLLDELNVSASIRDQTDFSFISHVQRKSVDLRSDLEKIRSSNSSLIDICIPPQVKDCFSIRESSRVSETKEVIQPKKKP